MKYSEQQAEPRAILALNNVSRIYYRSNYSKTKGGRVLLEHVAPNDLNLDIREGEFITIVGPSGCGKNTLLNIVASIDISYKDKSIDNPHNSRSEYEIALTLISR